MDDEKQIQVNKKEERRSWIWIMLMVNIVFILLLMTLGIIALQTGNKLPEGTDILFIVGKSPSVEVGDGKKWEAGQEVDIFKANYVNGQGQTTVLSQDGTAVIAPGTEMEYKFSMYNNGNMAVVYETDIDFTLTVGDETLKQYTFPLKVKLYTQNGAYLIGSKTEYEYVQDATVSAHVSQLGANSYETFVLQLLWEFDGGNDELDTLFGDKAVESGVSLKLGINTYAEEHIDPTAQGGTKIEVEGTEEYGGTIRWLWMILLFINAGILLFYVSWLLNKRLRKW
jgi:hypothetical protein